MTVTTGAVLVTGAASGIGKACALRLDRLGFRVFATVHDDAGGAALRREASDALTVLVMEITDAASVAAAAAAVTEAVGDAGLAALINNAGIALSGPIEFLPVAELRHQFEVNVIGQVAVTQAFLPLIRRAGGRVITIGSISGVSVLPFGGAYAASKHALRAINTALRMELRPWSIPVVIIDPSNIATPIWTKSASAGDARARSAPPMQQERYGRDVEIANEMARELAATGSPVEVVVDAAVHAITARRPKTRYVVGRNARLRIVMESLPVRLRDHIIIRRVLGSAARHGPVALGERPPEHE